MAQQGRPQHPPKMPDVLDLNKQSHTNESQILFHEITCIISNNGLYQCSGYTDTECLELKHFKTGT